MAKHDDNLDLIKLFGLSREEAGSLGLDASGQPPAEAAGLPAHADPAPPTPLTVAADTDPAPFAPLTAQADLGQEIAAVTPPAEDEQARIAEDIALLAMLNGLEAPGDYSGHGAARGLALVMDSTPSTDSLDSTPDPTPLDPIPPRPPDLGDNDDDDGARFFVAEAEEDVDVVGLFGLSGEEALGLGLKHAAPPLTPHDLDGAGTPAVGEPASAGALLPTMYLHAAVGHPTAPDAAPLQAEAYSADGVYASTLNDAAGVDERAPADPLVATWAEFPDGDGADTLSTDGTLTGTAQAETPALIAAADHLASVETVDHLAVEESTAPARIGAHDSGETTADAIGVAAVEPAWDEAVGADFGEPGIAESVGAAHVEREIDPALVEAFAEESAELLDGMHLELERLEKNQGDHEALLETRRIVHTLKGGAKMCGFEQVVTLTHSCENLLDLISDGAARLDATALHALFACEPLLRAAVQNALAGSTAEVVGLSDLAAYFDTLRANVQPSAYDARPGNHEIPPTPDETHDTQPAATEAHDTPPAERGEPFAPLSLSETPARPTRLVNTLVTVSDAVPAGGGDRRDAMETPATEPRPSGRRGANSLHVDLTKVDAVVAKVTEMAAHRVSSQGMMGQLMDAAEEAHRNVTRLHILAVQIGNECAVLQPTEAPRADDELGLETYNALNTLILQLQEAVSDQQALVQSIHDTITSHWRLKATESRIDADIQSALMNIRLIPIANMRVRLDGVVRQAAQSTGKLVRWQLQGGAVAVEKNVFDRLFEPLMHLLRNSIDHGIEAPAARLDAGKPETGAITVSAAQEGNQIVIAVADDGAGILPNRIAGLAVERGLISAEEANHLTPQQKISLIFTPGFSTAGEVSHLSGRGVGMDVVRETCLRMGGSIDVHSRPGFGATITMRLPLSLSVARGLIVRDGGCLMALPVSQISALHLVPATDMIHTSLGRMARIEGQELPIYNLPPLPGARPASYVQNGEVNVLQVPHEGGSIGIVIEDVLDEEEILIKAPPALLRHVTTLLGAYVLPDGTVAPVINLPQMLADLRPVATLSAPPEDKNEQEFTALVVDDSMSMRVALSGTLQSAGFTVLTARDGQEALDVLKREGLPSLITLDIEMPRMDGLETLFAIRQIPGARGLPVFMMTSRGGAKHRRAADQLGATRYFTKPYRDSELAGAARAAVGD